ncbi:MAG TPA: hypothetical protein VK652_15985 [Steroidobacteraceae bacterium]|nr:hypothetical protein [Steroidobacteraceae bacterium]
MNNLKRFTLAIACALIGLTGCNNGDDDGPPILFTTQIQSDPGFDGDIEQTSSTSFTITQGMSPTVQSVFAGIDPVARTEFRTFLDFPLTGGGGVPGNAIIDSAFLDVYINSLQPSVGDIPILIDLVSFQPPTLIDTDFDRGAQPALASVALQFFQTDVGTNVSIDVTPLMVAAQNMGLLDFQVRIMQDLGPGIPILLEINDTTGVDRGSFAPLLTVNYF